MDTADNASPDSPEAKTQQVPQVTPVSPGLGKPIEIDPDLDFIRLLGKQSGEDFKKCVQCGTCSGVCTLSPDSQSFPSKEMAWAIWGMKDRLLEDLDVWLCYQCSDCSVSCPRGARPGDVLAAIRQECIQYYSSPRFLGRWANQPQGILLLLGIPILLLTLALYSREWLAGVLGFAPEVGERIIYAYSVAFPHWLLNSFFGFFTLVALLIILTGVARFWRTMRAANTRSGITQPVKGTWASIGAALKSIITHDQFAKCEKARPRLWSHTLVFFGFIALTAVTLWVITAPYNPLIQGSFVYPFSFFSPWKMLANLGGTALLVGLFIMSLERVRGAAENYVNSFADWSLIATLALVVLTGFVTEILHYVRLEPHRHLAYFAHLVFVFALLMYLPYSKLAHVVYRTTAMVFAERFGRRIGDQPDRAGSSPHLRKEEEHVPESIG